MNEALGTVEKVTVERDGTITMDVIFNNDAEFKRGTGEIKLSQDRDGQLFFDSILQPDGDVIILKKAAEYMQKAIDMITDVEEQADAKKAYTLNDIINELSDARGKLMEVIKSKR